MALDFSTDSRRIISLALIAAGLLRFCCGAPTTPLNTDNPSKDPWWYHPCTSDINAGRIRHSRSTKNESLPVKRQLKIFMTNIKVTMKNIEKLYNGQNSVQPKVKAPNAKLKWLKVGLLVKNIKKSKNKFVKFQEALEYFAGTMEVLRWAKIQTQTVSYFDQESRRDIYENITHQLKVLLCEVYTLNQVRGDQVKGVPLKKMRIPPSFDKSLDFTVGHLVDNTFFSKASKFFNRTSNMLFPRKHKVTKKSATKSKKRT